MKGLTSHDAGSAPGGTKPGRRRRLATRTASPPNCGIRHDYVRPLLTQRSDVMNLEGLMLSAAPLAFAVVLTAFDAHGQTSRDCGGRSEAPAEVARVIDGRSFLLADGREVRLAAIETPLAVPGDQDEARVEAALAAKTALEILLLDREVHLFALNSSPDRYGRLVAYVFVPTSSGEALVQHELLAAGHALVSPAVPA